MRGVWGLLDRVDTARGSRPTTYERRKEAFGGSGYLTLPTSTKLALAGAGRRDICLQQRPFGRWRLDSVFVVLT